jgi:bacterioferritin-associated ferredoxin
VAIGASRKRHRPLGVSGSYIQGELVQVNGVPHVRSSDFEITEGLVVQQQNTWPSPRFNLLTLLRFLTPAMVRGGFERNALFPGGTRRFQWWERLLMHLAGEVSIEPSPDSVSSLKGRSLSVDTVVVGGGPSGREAANAAVRRGDATLLVTPGRVPGRRCSDLGGDLPILDPEVSVLNGHTIVGVYRSGHLLIAAPREGSHPATVIAASKTVLATGRRSCAPMVPGHDLPGVMDAHTAVDLARMLGAELGPAVIVGSGAEVPAAAALRAQNVQVAAVARVQEVTKIIGRGRVSGVVVSGARVACRTVVHAGPWMSDPSLAFQSAASGTLRLTAGELPAGVSVVGAAALVDEAVHLPNLDCAHIAVCPCMDVTAGELKALIDAGERHIEVLKRATGCGMGPCQGFPCWALARAVLQRVGGDSSANDRPSHRPPRAGLTVAQAAGLDGVVELN